LKKHVDFSADTAKRLEDKGHPECAEIAYLELINSVSGKLYTAGLATLRLGNLYLKMDRLDDAEKKLKAAKKVFERDIFSGNEASEFDLACARDSLGKLWEMRGNSEAAKVARFAGRVKGHELLCCASFEVSICNFSKSPILHSF
jgi:tetratricopeptide (TPR) repeat protein